jgi:hypothetical protein
MAFCLTAYGMGRVSFTEPFFPAAIQQAPVCFRKYGVILFDLDGPDGLVCIKFNITPKGHFFVEQSIRAGTSIAEFDNICIGMHRGRLCFIFMEKKLEIFFINNFCPWMCPNRIFLFREFPQSVAHDRAALVLFY